MSQQQSDLRVKHELYLLSKCISAMHTLLIHTYVADKV